MHDQGPKICLIGAGGMSFGPVMVLDAINTPQVRGATMMLHDVDPGRLDNARRFASPGRTSVGATRSASRPRSTQPRR